MFNKLKSLVIKLKLRQQILILLTIIFLSGVVISGVILANILNYNVQQEVSKEAAVTLKTLTAVRTYTNNQVAPELNKRLEDEFLPQTISNYAATEVFNLVRQNEAWQNYIYKEATLNPTNLRDLADDFETEIVNQFRNDQQLTQLNDFRSFPNGNFFYIALPLKVTEPSCLQCHSTPERAPKSMVERYGTTNGFGWKLNEIVGSQILYVPATKVIQRSRQQLMLILGSIILIYALTIFLVNVWLNKFVTKPLKQITKVAEEVSIGDMESQFTDKSNDEISRLTEAFNRMKTSLMLAIQRLKQKEN